MEKPISSKTVYDGKIMTVKKDIIVHDNGRQSVREIVHRPRTVSVLAVDECGRVLLVKQYRYAKNRCTLEIPAGLVEPDETPEVSARRELREETGYDCECLTPLYSYSPAIGYCTEEMTIYFGRKPRYSPLQGDEHSIALVRIEFDTLYDEITNGKSRFHDAKSALGILLARARGLV